MKSWRTAPKIKNTCHHGTNFNQYSAVRGHKRSLPHLHNQVQTSNKAHDKFVPRRDCACADHSRPSLSTALLGGWSSHLVNRVSPHNPLVPSTLARARRAYPSQARLGYAGAKRSASHLVLNRVQTSNKAHDKFVPRRDCACADHSRPSLSTALLSGWSSHLVLIGFRLTFPLSQPRTPWTRQARLRSSKACVRAHGRSASHLVLSSFILTKSFVKMPATFFSINSFASFSSSIVQMR